MGRLLDQRNEATLSEQPYRKKLIEVGLPLEAINKESAHEKSIVHGRPSGLHTWWARRPLAAARAVIFAQLVDDPSAHPDEFPTIAEQDTERRRLHELLENLMIWDNSTNPDFISRVIYEIKKSNNGKLPTVLDPFAGGGTIPVEAKRLGLDAEASDLNPVAVLLNKALIELPNSLVGLHPVNPSIEKGGFTWDGLRGLAEDVRYYGQWMGDNLINRVGSLYPAVRINGLDCKVIAWLWAWTIKSPNPANPITVPLVRSWWLDKRKGKEAWIKPLVQNGEIRYEVVHNSEGPKGGADGTVSRNGAVSIADGTPIGLDYVRAEAQAGRMKTSLIAIVGDGHNARTYISPTTEQIIAAQIPCPESSPGQELPEAALGFSVQNYGFKYWRDLFTNRQLSLLTTLVELISEVRKQLITDGASEQYANTIVAYLSLAVSKMSLFHTVLARWRPDAGKTATAFSRQVVSMVWDFAEANPFAGAGGDWEGVIEGIVKVILNLPFTSEGKAGQVDAAKREYNDAAVSTDPPYYDNIGYSDLSDYFYVWLRQSLKDVYPGLFSTILTPKSDELVANPHRHNGREGAEKFFVSGFNMVFRKIRGTANNDIPLTVYYAYKQQDIKTDDGSSSTGWHTLLDGLVSSGWEITATWPIRTEGTTRMRAMNSNTLASSIVLACRPRPENAGVITRRAFTSVLRQELPEALRAMMMGSIAPVDLAQAAIGPGISVFSRYSRVREADGSDMSVRDALLLISQTLDEVLNEQETDFDPDTRFAVRWYQSFGWGKVDSGEADTLARATSISIPQLERGGIFEARGGKARLITPAELSGNWNPDDDPHVSIWEAVARLSGIMAKDGTERVAALLPKVQVKVNLDAIKELGFLLYHDAEKKGNAEDALLFNSLISSWGDLSEQSRAAATRAQTQTTQTQMNFGE
jgi:putative DNA methylase